MQCRSTVGSSVKRCPAAQEAIRRFLCAACRVTVFLCTTCDRGQRYCSVECARSTRRRSHRESDRRYQSSERGRLKHAERSRRYRQRRRSVTDHSPAASPESDVSSIGATGGVSIAVSDEKTAAPLASTSLIDEKSQIKCHFCRRWCDPWVRHAPLRDRKSGPRRKPTRRRGSEPVTRVRRRIRALSRSR